jgi:diadenosine tetraphosphate (Ap4A) HIT family hydrolase
MNERPNCVMCRRTLGDEELERAQVWENDYWRLTMSLGAEVLGFSYLEPKRHIPYITDLDGVEVRTFGEVLAFVTKILKQETGTELVYIYVFGGGIPHLHVHLAPHREDDALNSQILRGEMVITKLPSGAESLASKDFPPLPEAEHIKIAENVRKRLADFKH